MALAPGTKLGRYDIRTKLGAGGMGEVYLAEDTALDRQVAIKVLPDGNAADAHAVKRLIREAKAAATLDHPNICAIYEVGEADGCHFIVMQRVEGETLAARLARAPLPVADTLSLASQIADALAEAHARGILHRDIKPQNVMVTPRGQAKLMDFGLATRAPESLPATGEAATESLLTTPGAVLGTVNYMSPEQVQGQPLDARSDIFSFGVMLYEMASGHHPFASESHAATASAILTHTPELVARFARQSPPELDRIITKAIAKDKNERYQSIRELLIDLQALAKQLAGGSGPILPVAPPTPFGAVARRPRLLRYALMAAGVVVLAAAAVYFGFVVWPHAAILTDKDTILLADFENTTGDAVLDGTLKTALTVQLEQSPFLSLFSDERVRETLGYMGRSPDEKVTKAIAREICQRQGLKALIAGSVSPLGSHYVVAIEAIDARTGDVLAPQQEVAESKEQILRALGQAATKLRAKLGESFSSIQKYDAPLEEATTTSLAALQAFTLAQIAHYRGNYADAIKQDNRAVALDPKFARAYLLLAASYTVTGEAELAIQSARKAFDLRDRVSERERLHITYWYYRIVTGEMGKAVDALETLTQTYPRFAPGHANLGNEYAVVGRYEEAIAELRLALALHPIANTYSSLADTLMELKRFGDARAAYQEALDKHLDLPEFHDALYGLAFIEKDQAAMKQQVDWARARPGESVHLWWRAATAASAGQARQARALSFQAVATAEAAHQNDVAAGYAAIQAATDALYGQCQDAKDGVAKSAALTKTGWPYAFMATALILCGDIGQAEAMIVKQFPDNPANNALMRPMLQAFVALHRRDAARARGLLTSASVKQNERGVGFWVPYARGLADQMLGKGADAAVEFQAILDHQGRRPLETLYPLARLGLARAAALGGDIPKARKAYEEFFAMWKDADADLPILIEAKKEYDKLK